MILRNPCKKCLVYPCCREPCDDKDYHNQLIEYIYDTIKYLPDYIIEGISLAILLLVEFLFAILIGGLLLLVVLSLIL